MTAPKTIEVTELALRDAHQSLMATRMTTEHMLPACADLDAAGFWSLECWGGATFDACIRFLNEDPWERLRTFKRVMPNTPLQMLLRGQNLLGYRHYGDDVVERFVERAAANGVDVFRVFDALNDLRNLRTAVLAVKRCGKHAQGAISYTVSPVHKLQRFVDLAVGLRELGCDSICIKDMAALLKPQPAYELVREIKRACGEDTRVHVHCHATTGVTLVSLMKAIEAGADIVDTAVSSIALGPGHNPTESLLEMLEGTGYTTRVDLERVLRVRDHFAGVRSHYDEFVSHFLGVETEVFASQIPGGMLSNMESQLRQQGAGDRIREVLAEVPRVRKASGYPPLVTPSSQIVGTQAVFNVLLGPYAVLSSEFADLLLGYYGATFGEKEPELVAKAAAQTGKTPISTRPADSISPEWEKLRESAAALAGSNGSDEDVLTYAMFPQVAPGFFAKRAEGPHPPQGAAKPAAAAAPASSPAGDAAHPALSGPVHYVVTVGGREHKVTVAPAAPEGAAP